MNPTVRVTSVVEPMFAENAYLIWQTEGGACWIFDPGLPPSAERLLRLVDERRLRPSALILTHGHLDHIAGVPDVLRAHPGLPVHIADVERIMLSDPDENLSGGYGVPITIDVPATIDLPPGGVIELEGVRWQILDTAGHSPGGRTLYCAGAGLALVGDALFAGSIGRTDFHHSDHDQLIRNIREKLLTLPGETRVYSGHGPATTIDVERRTNPFVGETARW